MSRYLLYGVFVQVLFTGLLLANTGKAQKESIYDVYLNISSKNLKTAIKNIEKSTDFVFTYNVAYTDLEQKVNITSGEKSLAEILTILAKETGYNFTRINNNIHIVEREHPKQTVVVKEVEPQQVRISGKVTASEDGEPLPGVSILVKGSSTGTTTDIDGNYSLSAPEGGILQFSYIGFITQEIPVGNQSTLNIALESDLAQLEEVVVVGYGAVKKSDVTGAIASVDGKALEQIPVASFDQKLQGQVAGVQVTQTSGAPGGGVSIRVRGGASITGSNEPLYVIDGVPISNTQGDFVQGFGISGVFSNDIQPQNPLASLNPNDIQNIEILKDASATAIYGSRGANGVVIITTKKGSTGNAKIQLDYSRGWQEVINRVDVLSGQEMAELRVEARRNGWIQNGNDPAVFDANPADVGALGGLAVTEFVRDVANGSVISDTDWQDEIFRTAPMTNLQLSASGGTDKTKYYVSGNYFKQDGIINGSSLERFTARVNIDTEINDKMKLSLNLTPSHSTNDVVQTFGRFANGNILHGAIYMHAFLPVLDDNGDYVASRSAPYMRGGRGPVLNPVASINEDQILQSHSRILGNLGLNYEIIDNLVFKTSLGTDLNFFRTNSFESPFRTFAPNDPNQLRNPVGRSTAADDISWLIENTLSYNKTLAQDHAISIVVGQTAQKATLQRTAVVDDMLASPEVPFPNAQGRLNGNAAKEQWSIISYLARANYTFKDKYLLTASVRTDGSSRFSENNKYGTFPALALAWKLDKENFMQNINWLSGMKLRGSWGQSGNFNIGNYSAIAGLNSSLTYLDANGNQLTAVAPSRLGNDELSWETTTQLNFGTDISLFDARVSITADYYVKNTEDLLLTVPIPSISGFGVALENIGEVENKGWEFTLSTVNVENDDFTWTSNFNISFNRNKVISLGRSDTDVIVASDNAGGTFRTEVGQPMSQFFGFIDDGIFLSQAEVDAHAFQRSSTSVGDRRFRDLNDDGVINADDQAVFGDPNPDFIFGFTNNFTYKNFDLNVLFSGVQGNDMLLTLVRAMHNANGNLGQHGNMRNRWRSEAEPGDGNTHRVVHGVQNPQNDRSSSFFLEDGSFIRLRNLSLGYTFTQDWLNKAKIDRLRVSFTGTNLLTLGSDYRGFDPEGNGRGGSALVQGSDVGFFPQAKTYTIGLSANF